MPVPFSIQLTYDQKTVPVKSSKMTFFDELYTDVSTEEVPLGQRIRLTIHPKQDIVVQNVQLDINHSYDPGQKIFCNGYQSWTESKEYTPQEHIPRLKWPATHKWKYQGDYQNQQIRRGPGHLHSWTYTYIRRQSKLFFCGSLNEHTGFTIFQHDCKSGQLSIQLDIENLHLSHSYPAIDLVILEGNELAVFDQYFIQMGISKPKAPRVTGWTSWYNHFADITEEIIVNNLQAFAEKETPIDIIQIDDGYQQAVGDWLKIKPSFPNGMGALARKIKAKGYKAGIWLAPFVCSSLSDIFKHKPQWLLKDANGQAIKAGYNKTWGGWYYALDFYKKEVQDYLTSVFFTLFNKWHFDLVKLDFLYAACLATPPNKTKGQVMCEAMDFIRQLAGNKWLLACGVPLGAAFGRVDYCRIGGDVHMAWEDKWLRRSRFRERTSTLASLRATLSRWQLNGRAFHNDPDVFILRTTNNQLSPAQQSTLLLVNRLLGNILFTSDNVADYSPEQWCEMQEIFNPAPIQVKEVVDLSNEQYFIHFVQQNIPWIAYINLSSSSAQFLHKKHPVQLEPYENIVLKG